MGAVEVQDVEVRRYPLGSQGSKLVPSMCTEYWKSKANRFLLTLNGYSLMADIRNPFETLFGIAGKHAPWGKLTYMWRITIFGIGD